MPLKGYFAFHPERISGWVEDGYGTTAQRVRIDVLRKGDVIASCEARREHRGAERFVFSLPVEGRFTNIELFKETVQVLARDSNGNSGQILLEGAAQLEVLSQHFRAPSVAILELDFGEEGNARPYLGKGWSYAEPGWTWATDDDSYINLDVPKEPGDYALRFITGTIVRSPVVELIDLDIYLNETRIASERYNASNPQFRECTFSHELFGSSDQAVLRFHHPGAVVPREVFDSKDTRRLAFSFRRLTLARLLGSGEEAQPR